MRDCAISEESIPCGPHVVNDLSVIITLVLIDFSLGGSVLKDKVQFTDGSVRAKLALELRDVVLLVVDHEERMALADDG